MSAPSKLTLANGRSGIGGCSYKAVENLNVFGYILLNGKIRLELPINESSRNRRSVSVDTTLKLYYLPSYEITNFSQQGYFQYVIFDNNRMSSKFESPKSSYIKINGKR